MLMHNTEKIIVYSAGVGEDISFDIDIMAQFTNCNIFAFDPTPKSIQWIKKQNLPANYNFFPYGISYKTRMETMYLPKNQNHISGSIYESNHLSKENNISVQMKCFEDIINENNHEYIDIIKMDIEGSEFAIIENSNFDKIKCGQILVEFHERFFDNGKYLLKKSLNILKKNGYCCFAISKSGEDWSFVKTDYHRKLVHRNFNYKEII
jgi:FkbM family methyltransferase